MQGVSSIFPCRAPPPPQSLSLHHFPFKTHVPNLLFPTTTTATTIRPSLLSAPRKFLCRPPRGKYLRDNYIVKKVSAKEVQELVKGERKVPLVIDFYAEWCGPCILMAQVIEMVRGLPTVYFISPDPNKEAVRTEGLVPIHMMRDILNNEM